MLKKKLRLLLNNIQFYAMKFLYKILSLFEFNTKNDLN